MNTDDIKRELKQKERLTKDLLRFITTRNDHNPNYSLLLGSGCSVTSNIRSGGALINEWREEIHQNLIKYDEEEQDKTYTVETAKNYLTKKCGSWYNSSNEYSSLFEKKYDLPRQRRMFVEKEVSEKTPAIGYAYLINLIKDTYFNTIFTTNFDDLINEAFYQFSEDRPMICAHDSSINSITVTSKRPKIIKLHGDYLFDDIKSTLRETESLEDNIRNKFIEFAKDYGLIVIGYGGHDRSIMDVLSYLLKHDDYYKNGIYWCLRKGDEIGEDLRKLLWKDRVYFVEVDGFDELFAELHNEIYKEKLPIDTNFISNKSQDIIQKFIENKYLSRTTSEIIKKDIKNLENQNERNNLYESIKQMKSDDNFGNDKLENKEVKILIELANLFKEDQYNKIIDVVNETLRHTENKDFKIELYKRMINSYIRLNRDDDAMKITDILIEIDGNNPYHLIYKAGITKNFKDKLSLVERAIEIDSYNERFLNKKIDFMMEEFDVDEKNHVKFQEIKALLDKSLEINPFIENNAWSLKFDFLFECDKEDRELKEIIKTLEKQRPYSVNVLQMKYELLSNNDERKSFMTTVKEAKHKFLSDNKLKYELLLLRILDEINDKEEIFKLLESLSNNKLYKKDSIFLRNKATMLLKKFDNLKEAINLLKQALEEKRSSQTVLQLIDYLLNDDNIEEANAVFSKNKYILSKEQIINIKKDIYDKEKDYANAYKQVEKLQKLNEHKSDKHISTLSYYLLQQAKYSEAKELLRKYLEAENFSPKLSTEIINYELACKRVSPSYTVNKKRLESIINRLKNQDNELTKAAISALENNELEAIKELKNKLDKDFSSKYEFKDWPVFYAIRNSLKFKELLNEH